MNEDKKLELLFYELQMFNFATNQLTMNEKSKLDKNAIIEVFLIHTRNFIEFFMGTASKTNKPPYRKKSTDILIIDFKDQDNKSLNLIGEMGWNIKISDKDNINKWLSHLSEERFVLPHKEWTEEVERFEKEIKSQINFFINKVLDSYFPILVENKKITKNDFKLSCKQGVNASSSSGITATCSDVSGI